MNSEDRSCGLNTEFCCPVGFVSDHVSLILPEAGSGSCLRLLGLTEFAESGVFFFFLNQ